MKKIFLLTLFTIFFSSCAEELVTVIDEYNIPYEIKAIPGDGKVSISFWSGILASDFAGFNLYAKTSEDMIQPDDAILNVTDQSLPTVKGTNHTRTNFTMEIPYNFINGTKYYVTVTAYGTNELIEDKYIETQIDTIVPVIPRPEGTSTITGNNMDVTGVGTIGTKNGNMINASTPWKVQYFGYQTDFNSVVIVTNMNGFDDNAPYLVNGLYIFYNGAGLVKVLIGDNDTYQWAYQGDAASWNGV
ncbi:hypothetical protein [Brachyspira sp. SAP_772]|uniref:hypothetical protein n=1 Tax=Brachyspira sp. SAP_772 TaxID=2608385 RepID=UPI0012F4AA27|nr:hypothetical protein [Brachyspira sp. SAP_772]